MKNRSSLNNLFSHDRKVLYMLLSIVMISVLTLTVVYAALSTTLNINGNAEVSAASWDIYLDNVKLNSGSATTGIPTISDRRRASFSTTLNKPGDFYEFTIDVVNNGSIDAMIDSVVKTPELSTSQAKYLDYVIEYQNGESINTKQLVGKKSFVRLKVKVEFRKDVSSADLPTISETLDFSFVVNYVQSDDSGSNVVDNGVKKVYRIVSGDLQTPGSEIAIGDEHFYVLYGDDESVTVLTKNILHVGNKIDLGENGGYAVMPMKNPTGRQLSTFLEPNFDGEPQKSQTPSFGLIPYISDSYWWDSSIGDYKSEYQIDYMQDGRKFPYTYDNNSLTYSHVENYKTYLESLGVQIEEARLIKLSELIDLGCVLGTCNAAPSWIYRTTYWTGVSSGDTGQFCVMYHDALGVTSATQDSFCGIRPVIKISL